MFVTASLSEIRRTAKTITKARNDENTLSGHLKTGQSSTPQNRPVEAARRVAL
jgi:hypothetical protein